MTVYQNVHGSYSGDSYLQLLPLFHHFVNTVSWPSWGSYQLHIGDKLTSATMGRQEGAIVSSGPTDVTSFFVGFTSPLFAFGGHTSNIGVADVMVSKVPQLLGLFRKRAMCREI